MSRSLEVLRAEAADEIAMIIEHRCRLGDDPWDFIPSLPTIDEHVVLTLRAEALEADARIGERIAQHGVHPASGHGTRLGQEYHRLRRIALMHPELSETVWRLLSAIPDEHRRLDDDV